MSIAFELSSDVAAAMLANSNSQSKSLPKQDLTRIVVEFHGTLRRLAKESRRSRLLHHPPTNNLATSSAAGSN